MYTFLWILVVDHGTEFFVTLQFLMISVMSNIKNIYKICHCFKKKKNEGIKTNRQTQLNKCTCKIFILCIQTTHVIKLWKHKVTRIYIYFNSTPSQRKQTLISYRSNSRTRWNRVQCQSGTVHVHACTFNRKPTFF